MIVLIIIVFAHIRNIPDWHALLKKLLKFFDGRELPIHFKICFAIAALDVLSLDIITCVHLLIEAKREIVHVLCLCEVIAATVRDQVHVLVNDFRHDINISMVNIVCHWNHGRRGQAQAIAARADLRVKLVEEVRSD